MAGKRKRQSVPRPAMVREPLQIYMTSDERSLLDQLAQQTGVSRAEVLRRGLRSYAAEQLGEASPMLQLMDRLQGSDWPHDIGREHDAYLAQSYAEDSSATELKWSKSAVSSSTRRRGSRR